MAADKHFGMPAVAFSNEQVAAGWADIKLQPAPGATDGEWCRRVHLDVIGRVPTVDELEAFLADPSPTKQAGLVDRLLGEEFSEEYASNWTDVWTTLLIGRSGDNDRVNRSGMRQWLRRALARNMPYDQFMDELVTATGVNKAGEPGFNGATNFLAGKLEENACRRPPKRPRFFSVCRSNARSATIIRSIPGGRISSGNSMLSSGRPRPCADLAARRKFRRWNWWMRTFEGRGAIRNRPNSITNCAMG